MKKGAIIMLLVVLGCVPGRQAPAVEATAPAAPEETKEQRDARMKWWREAKFGLFIHWGIYSVPAGVWQGKDIPGIGEWIMNRGKIPVADYAAFAKQFNPTKFNAEEWVLAAKNAGMKYIVITSKHHDGFAMFHSQDPYNIYDATPFKRDPLKELAEACKKHDMKLGFYYSQAQDWHHPGGAAAGGHWDKAQDGSMDDYLKNVAVPQVKEILSNYGPVAVLWWDTPVNMTKERADLFLPLLKLQPGIITNNRLGGGYRGDTETPEQHIPATGFPGRDWETCMTMNNTWGYKSKDNNWKPTSTLVRNLIDIASKGGNYLLNVGPTAEGLIPQPSLDRLAEVGKWMKTNGDAIYATTASPFKRQLPWGRCTQKPGKLYLHVFDWPKDGKLLVPVTNKPVKAYLLAEPGKALETAASPDGVTISLPAAAPDAIASVVALEIDGEPKPTAAAMVPDTPPAGGGRTAAGATPIKPTGPAKEQAQAADGSLALPASAAEIVGGTARIEGEGERNIGFWTNAGDYARWLARVEKPGSFTVELQYSCADNSAGSEWVLDAGGQTLTGKVAATGGWKTYRTAKVGTLRIEKAGQVSITLKATTKPGLAVMNLRGIVLKPAP